MALRQVTLAAPVARDNAVTCYLTSIVVKLGDISSRSVSAPIQFEGVDADGEPVSMPELDEAFVVSDLDQDAELLTAVQALETIIINRCDADAGSNLSKGAIVEIATPEPEPEIAAPEGSPEAA